MVSASNDRRYDWTDSTGTPTLTQALTISPPSSSTTTSTTVSTATRLEVTTTIVTTTDALTSVSFDFYWQNNSTGATDSINILRISYGGTNYAFIGTGGNPGTSASALGLNGASVSLGGTLTSQNEISGGTTPGTMTITLPGGITSSGNLVFSYSGIASDDLAIDNVVALSTKTTTTTATTVRTEPSAPYDWNGTFIENGSPVSIADTDSSIFDSDSANMENAAITLTNPATGDRLLVNGTAAASGTLASGISWTRTDILVTLSGTFSKAQYANAIELIRFENTTDTPSTTNRFITVKVNDGTNDSDIATTRIFVNAVNDAPVAVADVGAVAEDATLTTTALTGVIQGAPGADSDAEDATSTLRVSGAVAGSGAVVQGVGVGTVLAGTLGHLTLNRDGSYSYVADNANSLAAGVTATDVFSYTVRDLNNAISNPTTLTVTVTGSNDAPVAVDDSVTATEDSVFTSTVSLIANDTDVDGPGLSAVAGTSPPPRAAPWCWLRTAATPIPRP